MSLILEALRKSEAERRRGLPPDLYAELPPAPAPRGRSAPAWWWMLLPVVAVVAVVAWWALRGSEPAPIASQPPASSGLAPAAPPATVSVAPTPARSPSASAPPVTVAQPAPTLPQPTSQPATPAPEPAPPPAAAVTAPEPKQPDRTAAIAPPPAVQPAAAPKPGSPPPKAPAPAPAEPGRVLLLGELDGDSRRALPPLKLSMHLWNEDPARRFVILDGQRLGEGDRVGEATITTIERDSVLLDWNGRGIRVPVH